MDISKGRYWQKPWSLISGCTPCSPGCDHCWSAGMAHRFCREGEPGHCVGILTDEKGRFNGDIITHPESLSIPLKRRKPTVYAVWNDLFHEAVPTKFIDGVIERMYCTSNHTYLVLTKRPERMSDYLNSLVELSHEPLKMFQSPLKFWPFDHVYCGLTVVNQAELDAKMGVFLQVPGKKFLSIEPMMGPVDVEKYLIPFGCRRCVYNDDPRGCNKRGGFQCSDYKDAFTGKISAVILGGETGPGARPMHPDWVRSVRDQCAAAGVPFFFKSWGKHIPNEKDCFGKETVSPFSVLAVNVKRLLDGHTHDELPWATNKGVQ